MRRLTGNETWNALNVECERNYTTIDYSRVLVWRPDFGLRIWICQLYHIPERHTTFIVKREWNWMKKTMHNNVFRSQNSNSEFHARWNKTPKMINWNHQNGQNCLYLVFYSRFKQIRCCCIVVVFLYIVNNFENFMIYCFKTKKIGFDTLTDFH